nr:MAG TPA: hypothetical protein [Caudoviricetes sp.]
MFLIEKVKKVFSIRCERGLLTLPSLRDTFPFRDG